MNSNPRCSGSSHKLQTTRSDPERSQSNNIEPELFYIAPVIATAEIQNMYGPERWGCVLFALNNVEEQSADPAQEAESGQNHTLRIRGELFLGITHRRHSLPRSIWDRQRYGGLLSDGSTRVWWIIHDTNIPGRIGERYFSVLFTTRHLADTRSARMRSFQQWRGFVRRQWSEYLRAGRRRVERQVHGELLGDGWSSRLMAALR